MTKLESNPLAGCLRPAELADRLQVDPTTLDDWRKRRGLPGFKVGGRRYYRLADVNTWLRKQEAAK